MPQPLQSAVAVLPGQRIEAAGVFGVQDQVVAAGLLGADRVAAAQASLVAAGAGLDQYRPWVPAPCLLAVSPDALHVLDWDPERGCSSELARFDRRSTEVAVDEAGTAVRVSLRDSASGYLLLLTGTTSRLSAHGSGVRRVLARLPVRNAG